MPAQNDTIRRVAHETETNIHTLQPLVPVPGFGRELALAITNLEQGVMWLKKVGHGSHFDTPTDGSERIPDDFRGLDE